MKPLNDKGNFDEGGNYISKPKETGKKPADEDVCSLPGPARGGIDDGSFQEELLAALTGEPEQIKKTPLVDILPLPLKVTHRNLELGYLIGPITEDVGDRAFEVGGFFTMDQADPAYALTDFIIPRDLPVAPGAILIAEHYPETSAELQDLNKQNGTKRRLSAMFHIHPMLNSAGMFHSGDDDRGLASLLNKMAVTNRIVQESPYALIQSRIRSEYGPDRLVLRGDELSDAIVRFVYPNDLMFFDLLRQYGLQPDPADFKKAEFLGKLLETVGHETAEPRIVRFATSFVFENDRKGPYVKMRIEEQHALTGTKKYFQIVNPELEVLAEGINLPTEDEVVALVKERVKFPPKPKVRKFKGGKGSVSRVVGWAWGESDADDAWVEQYVPAAGVTTKTWGPYGGSAKSQVKKEADPSPTMEELAQRFTLAFFGYTTQSRDKECKYSVYADEIFSRMSRFGSMKEDTTALGDLRSIVLDLTEISEDKDEVDAPGFEPYKARQAAENLSKYQQANPDETTIKFMIDFVRAPDLASQSRVLEQYVRTVYEDHRKSLDDRTKPQGIAPAPDEFEGVE